MSCKYTKTKPVSENWIRILDYNPNCSTKDNFHYIWKQFYETCRFGSIKLEIEHNLGYGSDAPYKAIYIDVNDLKLHLYEPIIIKYYYGDGAFLNNVEWIIKGDPSKTAPYYFTFIIRPDKLP